ncbi:hypothetical protein D3C81_763800 [compost metagenome]
MQHTKLTSFYGELIFRGCMLHRRKTDGRHATGKLAESFLVMDIIQTGSPHRPERHLTAPSAGARHCGWTGGRSNSAAEH